MILVCFVFRGKLIKFYDLDSMKSICKQIDLAASTQVVLFNFKIRACPYNAYEKRLLNLTSAKKGPLKRLCGRNQTPMY